jgi:hypothetical protein
MWKDKIPLLIHLFLKSVLSFISPLRTQVAIKMGDFENRFSPGSFGWGKLNVLPCVHSLLALSYDGDVDRYITWICYQGVLQK